MLENIANLSLNEQKVEIHKLLCNKMHSLLSRIDCIPEHNQAQRLNVDECPLELPEQLANEFHDYLKSLYIELAGPNAPLEKLTDSWYFNYAGWANCYKEDAEYAYEDANRRTLWEIVTQSNNQDIILYKQSQVRLAEYMLKAMAKDFLEDAVGDDSLLV